MNTVAKLISHSIVAPDAFPDEEDIPENLMELVAYCARVSNPANQNNHETSERLINYLIKHKHWSPFEMVNVCVEINTTRDIARQILRHRSFSFQEFSQRYADVTDIADQGVIRETRLQDDRNRQNSVEVEQTDDTVILRRNWEAMQTAVWNSAVHAYQWALSRGIAKEVARSVLPEGMTPSRLYMNGTLRSWIHYLELRTGNGTQKEHMEVAEAIAEAVSEIFPLRGLQES